MKNSKKITVLSVVYLVLSLASLGVDIALIKAKRDEKAAIEAEKEWYETLD